MHEYRGTPMAARGREPLPASHLLHREQHSVAVAI